MDPCYTKRNIQNFPSSNRKVYTNSIPTMNIPIISLNTKNTSPFSASPSLSKGRVGYHLFKMFPDHCLICILYFVMLFGALVNIKHN